MSKELSTSFDYKLVDDDTRRKLISISGDIRREKKEHIDYGMKIGKSIAAAHDLCASDGLFTAWIEAEGGYSRQTAYNYMWAWQKFGKCKSLLHFTQEAMYALASPKAPENAVMEAMKLADKGVRVNKNIATDLIEQSTLETKPKPIKPPKSDPSPAEDEPPQVESISTDKAEEPAAKKISGGITFDTAELTRESKDAFGDEAPEALAKVFELAEGFKEQRSKITSIKTWITQNENHPGAAVLSSAAQRLKADLDQADSELKFSMPYCVCMYCGNKSPKVTDCNACKGLGWVTEPVYQAAPKGIKREKAKR